MSGWEVARAAMLVENAHPRRIAGNAEEWQRCAQVLEDAAERIDQITLRQSDIGGQTGPSMALAAARAADALRVKARDLRRGGEALDHVAEVTRAHREERRRIDRDHPDDGQHVAWREEGSRRVADSQESALRQGIAVMKSIQTGDDPRRTPVQVSGPGPLTPPTVTWWPPRHEIRTDPPIDLNDHDDELDEPATPQGPTAPVAPTSAPVSPTAGPSSVSGSGGSSFSPAAAAGSAALGSLGVAAVARGVSAGSTPPGASGARGIGGGTTSGSGGVLGRSAGGGGTSGSTGAGGRGAGGAGAGASGGRGGRRTKDDKAPGERDLFDDGEGWLDDDAAPGVLR